MNLKLIFSLSALTFAATAVADAKWEGAPRIQNVSESCAKGESWKFGKGDVDARTHELILIPAQSFDEYWKTFRDVATGGVSPVRGFSFALSLRNKAQNRVTKAFSEYWIARALYQAGLTHIAWNGFASIVAQDALDYQKSTENHPLSMVQAAALTCLKEIQTAYPGFAFERPELKSSQLEHFLTHAAPDQRRDVLVYVLQEYFAQASQTNPKSTAALVKMMDQFQPKDEKHGAMTSTVRLVMQAVQALLEKNNTVASDKFQAVLAQWESIGGEADVGKFRDQILLLNARALFGQKRYLEAKTQIQKIKRSSNDLTQSLQELAWNYLHADQYNEAIGAATGLQSGLLKSTFSPEATMVMAMAMNELCQFPDSIRAINSFKKNYEKPYRYLASLTESEEKNLYPKAIAFLKKDKTIPSRVASEWVKSPVFISLQDELNLLKKERLSAVNLAESGVTEQKKLADQILKLATEIRPRVRFAKSQLKPGQELPATLTMEIEKLKANIRAFSRIGNAGETWKLILANHQTRVPTLERHRLTTINAELARISKKLRTVIEEVAENTQLIEVEIFNGASHDLIWQNAHPDYQKFAQNLKESNRKSEAARVWNWGQIAIGDEQESEIWEDEVGSFRADLEDNCNSKDRYLSVKFSQTQASN